MQTKVAIALLYLLGQEEDNLDSETFHISLRHSKMRCNLRLFQGAWVSCVFLLGSDIHTHWEPALVHKLGAAFLHVGFVTPLPCQTKVAKKICYDSFIVPSSSNYLADFSPIICNPAANHIDTLRIIANWQKKIVFNLRGRSINRKFLYFEPNF